MDVPTLILLGAAGGLLRGALDLYTRFGSWQNDRRIHRQLTASATGQAEAPQFQAYFDPAVDTVAAVVHSLMGAGAAVLFGTTGQISGGYAALVVGISAPMLLTQLGRIETVNQLVTGERQPADAEGAGVPSAEPAGAGAVEQGDAVGSDATQAPGAVAAASPSVRPPRRSQRPGPSAEPVRPSAPPGGLPSHMRPRSSSRRPATVADARTQEPTSGELPVDRAQLPDTTRAGDTRISSDSTEGSGPGLDGQGAPPWRQGPPIGEEGL
ncbi:hypothetical protein [Streptomyces sp. NBC_00893]|uniref:hypothetical protein n=1 Tax=Streptomyces sp. NBC_00893 TaxID=2975862 RepID=UPI00225B586F|nr:hypothetical protein [Streptomyces sp. NBC_00893]MCX4851128.1 hypothetical protein [Streptomyces sp. NBC_00893]